MMQKKKIWIKLLSVILAVIVFLTTQEIPVFADIDLSNVTVVESITMNRNGQANIEVNLPSEVPIDSVTISYAFKDGAATDVVDLDAYTGYLTAQKAGTTIIVTTIKAVTDKPIQKTMETLVKVLEPADILDQAEKVDVTESMELKIGYLDQIQITYPEGLFDTDVTISYAIKEGAAEDVAEVDQNGLVKALNAGTTTIVTTMVLQTDDTVSKTGETIINVINQAEILDQLEKLDVPEKLIMRKDCSKKIEVGIPENLSESDVEINFSIKEGEDVIQVDDQGEITAQNSGIATIVTTMTSVIDQSVQKTAETKVKVFAKPQYNSEINKMEWEYVYFGSYPQSEVSMEELTNEMKEADYDQSGDAWINGTKYRRVLGADGYRYFRWEQLRWKVLDVEDHNLVLLADQGIYCGPYYEDFNTYMDLGWKNCSIRAWMNDTFYKEAFSRDQKNIIVNKEIATNHYLSDASVNEIFTKDNVYLLSYDDLNSNYGLNENDYRVVSCSAYALTRYDGSMEHECQDWWLRTPSNRVSADGINSNGSISEYYFDSSIAYVPAITIDGLSDSWYSENTISKLEDQEIQEGEETRFRISIGGGELSDYTYQWYYAPSFEDEGIMIYGAESYFYTIPSVTAYNSGYYYCEVNDGGKIMRTNKAKLSVYAPFQTAPVKDQYVNLGNDAVFSVKASGGRVTDYTYQWYWAPNSLDEATLIEGAVSSDYVIPAREITIGLNGYFFYCVVSNGEQTITTNKAKLTVSESPASLQISMPSNKSVKKGTSVTFQVEASGGNFENYGYQWYYSISEKAKGEKIKGAVSNSYTIPASDVTKELNGRYYYCVVKDGREEKESGRAKLSVWYPPSVSGPKDLSVSAGASVTFKVTKNGGNPSKCTYQWYYATSSKGSGYKISGAVSSSYTIPGSGVKKNIDGRYYYCVVSNGKYSVTSTRAKLKIKIQTVKNLSVKLNASNAVKVTWKKIDGVDGYYVYRSNSRYVNYKKIATVKAASYLDKNLKGGRVYYYKVAAYKGKSIGVQSAARSKKIGGKVSTPKMKFTRNVSKRMFTISWNKIKNATRMEIWRKVDNNGEYEKWKTVNAKRTSVTYSYKNFAPGHNYYFKIRAYYINDVPVYSFYSKGFGMIL